MITVGGEFRHLLGNFSVKMSGDLGWWLDLAFSEMRKIIRRLCAAADLTENENLIAGPGWGGAVFSRVRLCATP